MNVHLGDSVSEPCDGNLHFMTDQGRIRLDVGNKVNRKKEGACLLTLNRAKYPAGGVSVWSFFAVIRTLIRMKGVLRTRQSLARGRSWASRFDYEGGLGVLVDESCL